MRYIIIGAGAVGGSIGGRLVEGGHQVVLVARGAHYSALRDQGLRLSTPDGTRTVAVAVASGPHEVESRPDDVLVMAVKTQHAVAALDEWSTEHGDSPVLCAQNGVVGEVMAARRFREVYGMCVWLPSTHLRPGHVVANCAPLTGILHLGRYPRGTGELAHRIAADLEKSYFAAPVVEDVMRWKYAKLLSNLGNAVDAVLGPDAPDSADLLRQVRAEGRVVLDAAGIDYVSEAEQAAVRGDRMRARSVDGIVHSGSSSWQSLMRGTGSIEADYLNGEIVLLARKYGIPAPLNELLQRTANTFARESRAPGSISAQQLLARLD
ncbi:ketopantoate reductase family protein [Nocardia sp. NPDC058705]|uniref:ketopantoate reductase family protein n=1 Tax=Nocardia sp. NPDC058705 TaxID=3346609 RepID=UPI00367BEAEF